MGAKELEKANLLSTRGQYQESLEKLNAALWFFEQIPDNDQISEIKKQIISIEQILRNPRSENLPRTDLVMLSQTSEQNQFNLKEFFLGESPTTFLVGAGCSIDRPSCLPAGRSTMAAIIEYICPQSEVVKIKELEQLRFEALMEIVQNNLDPNLEILDYYALCDKPNLQHIFLAERISKGNFVLTTNFDCLIEHALRQLGVPDEKIVPIITKEDFEENKFPKKLFQEGKKSVYKIHGSTKNLITGADTRKYLVATIRAFGANKEGLNVFQIEPFKRELFNNITEGYSLVIMGYSGSDDFDIVPTLKILKNLKNVIWLNYTYDVEMGSETVFEITEEIGSELDKIDQKHRKVTQILYEIYQMNNAEHIYRVDVNTSKLAAELLQVKPKISPIDFSVDISEWIKKKIETPSELMKQYIASSIYLSFNEYDLATTCAEAALNMSTTERDYLFLLNYIGMIFYEQRDFPAALQKFEEIIAFRLKTGEMYGGDPILFYNMGTIYYKLRNYSKALNLIGESLQIERRIIDQRPLYHRRCFNGLGLIYKDVGNYAEALRWFDQALKMDDAIGDLPEKAKHLNNIGLVYLEQKNYSDAKERFELALKIAENLGDLVETARCIKNLGEIFQHQENYQEALATYENALQITKKHDFPTERAIILTKIGEILLKQGKDLQVLENYEEAIQIFDQHKDLINVAFFLNEVGQIYQKKINITEQETTKTIETYLRALSIIEKISDLTAKSTFDDDFRGVYENLDQMGYKYETFIPVEKREDILIKSNILKNIAKMYQDNINNPSISTKIEEALEKQPELLKFVKNALHENIEFGNLQGSIYCFTYIGSSYEAQRHFKEALSCYEEALNIFRDENKSLGDLTRKMTPNELLTLKNILIIKKGVIYRKLSNFQEAIDYFKEAVANTEKLGDYTEQFLCLDEIAKIYQTNGPLEQALDYYNQALEIAKQLNDEPKKFFCIYNMAKIHKSQGDFTESLKLFNEALQIAEVLNDNEKKILILGQIAEALLIQEKYQESLEKFKIALEISEQINSLNSRVMCLYSIGSIYIDLQDYSEALVQFEAALKMADQFEDPTWKSMCLTEIAEIHLTQKDYQTALNEFIEAYKIAAKLGDQEGQLRCLMSASDIYIIDDNLETAKKLLEEGFQILYQELGLFDQIPKGPPSLQPRMKDLSLELQQRWERIKNLLKE